MPPKTPAEVAAENKADGAHEIATIKLSKATSEEAIAAPWKGPRLKNLALAHFYADDQGGADGNHSILGKGAVAVLTEAQWKRRTPAQWGVLVANELISLNGVPDADAAAVDAAEAAESARLGRVDNYTSLERSVMRGLGGDAKL